MAARRQRPLVGLDAIEHDDGVVQRVAHDREEGHHGRRRHLEPEQRVGTDGQHDVVPDSDERSDRHLPLEAEPQVQRDQHEEHHERPPCLARHLVAEGRADLTRRQTLDVDIGSGGQRSVHVDSVDIGPEHTAHPEDVLGSGHSDELHSGVGHTGGSSGSGDVVGRRSVGRGPCGGIASIVGGVLRARRDRDLPHRAALELNAQVEPAHQQRHDADEHRQR